MTPLPSHPSIAVVAHRLEKRPQAAFTFSICSLVNKPELYEIMVASFLQGGFNLSRCEYLYIDNSSSNRHDAFSGVGELIAAARGEYVILCHQDVRLIEQGFDDLLTALRCLEEIDPHWALAGNAGRTNMGDPLMCISDRRGANQRQGVLPSKTVSLDENFIVLRRSAQLAPSVDLAGWHLYGADLCLQARFRGLNAYVIDFHTLHESGALRIDQSYFYVLEALEDKYHALFQTYKVHTTCLTPVVTSSGFEKALTRLKRLRKKTRSIRKHRPVEKI
jgi:hypothetical protein